MSAHEKINYVEIPANDLDAVKDFFSKVFAWKFTDYGSEYTAFTYSGLDGGFYKSDAKNHSETGGALVVIFSENLNHTLDKVMQADMKITKPIFKFPGGQRFQFLDPCGNEWGVWSL